MANALYVSWIGPNNAYCALIGSPLNRTRQPQRKILPHEHLKIPTISINAPPAVEIQTVNAVFATGTTIAARPAKPKDPDTIYSIAPNVPSQPLTTYIEASCKMFYLPMKMSWKILASTTLLLLQTDANFSDCMAECSNLSR